MLKMTSAAVGLVRKCSTLHVRLLAQTATHTLPDFLKAKPSMKDRDRPTADGGRFPPLRSSDSVGTAGVPVSGPPMWDRFDAAV